jgi:hypothetical protein
MPYFCSPARRKFCPAIVVGLGVKDSCLRRAEQQGDGPRDSKHRVRLVDRPTVVRQRITDGLKLLIMNHLEDLK